MVGNNLFFVTLGTTTIAAAAISVRWMQFDNRAPESKHASLSASQPVRIHTYIGT